MNTETEQTFEQTSAESAGESASATTAPDTAGLQAEVEKYKDAALRARAEFDNYRKRVVREKEDAIRYANSSLFESLLPILDNFELGLGAAKNSADASGIVQGFEMVRKQLEDFLRSNGVEVVEALGREFDPNLHEAVGQEASADVAEGVVLRQLRRGFTLRDRLLRPSTVVVSKGAE
jgi:molecular chaperone GrpE